MGTTTFKRFAAAGAISGTLSFAVLGLGAGLANADDDGPGVPWGCRGSLGKLLAIGCSRGFKGASGGKVSGGRVSGAKVSGRAKNE